METVGKKTALQPKDSLMNHRFVPDIPPRLALELYQPEPNVLYSLNATAHLAGVPRRSILVYCHAGLVRPVVQPPCGESSTCGPFMA